MKNRIELSNVQFRLLYKIAKNELVYTEKDGTTSYFLQTGSKLTKIGKSTVVSLLSKQAVELVPSLDNTTTGKVVITERGKRAFNLYASTYQIAGDKNFIIECY